MLKIINQEDVIVVEEWESIPVYDDVNRMILRATWTEEDCADLAVDLELGTPSGDNVYFTGEVLGGLHVVALPLFDLFELTVEDPPFIPTLALNLTFACPPPESSGYWVYY